MKTKILPPCHAPPRPQSTAHVPRIQERCKWRVQCTDVVLYYDGRRKLTVSGSCLDPAEKPGSTRLSWIWLSGPGVTLQVSGRSEVRTGPVLVPPASGSGTS